MAQINHPAGKTLETQLAYIFDSDQIANRFLNDVRSGTVPDVAARFFGNNKTIKITFKAQSNQGSFDNRCSQLDDMALQYKGSEVTV